MSVTMEKPAEQDVVAEKVKSIVGCYIKRKKVVMTTISAPVAEAVEGCDTVHLQILSLELWNLKKQHVSTR